MIGKTLLLRLRPNLEIKIHLYPSYLFDIIYIVRHTFSYMLTKILYFYIFYNKQNKLKGDFQQQQNRKIDLEK